MNLEVVKAAFFDELQKIAACKEKDSGFDIKGALAARAMKLGPASVGRGTFQAMHQAASNSPGEAMKGALRSAGSGIRPVMKPTGLTAATNIIPGGG